MMLFLFVCFLLVCFFAMLTDAFQNDDNGVLIRYHLRENFST